MGEGMTGIPSIQFLESTDLDIPEIGGKAKNLAQMVSGGFSVPSGFVITVSAYEEFLSFNGIRGRILDCLESTDFESEAEVEACSQLIKGMIIGVEMNEKLIREIEVALERGGSELWAVRSSAAAEDLPEASFAGQQDTFLCTPPEDVPRRVRECWSSYWNARALRYRHDAGVDQLEGGIAVVVQGMVPSEVSGIMFTRDPLGSPETAIVESSWGLGESIVSGLVSPDRFVVERNGQRILEKEINRKERAILLQDGGSVPVEVEEGRQMEPSLDPRQVERLVQVGRNLETFFGATRSVAGITTADADAWRAWLVDHEGLSVATVGRRVVAAVPEPASEPGKRADARIRPGDRLQVDRELTGRGCTTLRDVG